MSVLLAACRDGDHLTVKHIQLNDGLRDQVAGIFAYQQSNFLSGISDEVSFDGSWKPDPDELLVASGLPEVNIMLDAANANALALPPLDIANFQREGVKGLFMRLGTGNNRVLLVQNFDAQQLLSSKFAMLYDGNVFRRLVEPGFSLGNSLVAIVTMSGEVKFKSYALLRRILNLSPIFREATDDELNSFCAHASIEAGDPAAFRQNADEGLRKAVHLVIRTDVLDRFTVAAIKRKAVAINFSITVKAGRIQMPSDRKDAKALLGFLLNRVYQGPIDPELFITNSHRRL